MSPVLAEIRSIESAEATRVSDYTPESPPLFWYHLGEKLATVVGTSIHDPTVHLWEAWSVLQRRLFPKPARYFEISETVDLASDVEDALLELVRNDIRIERVPLVRNYLLLHSDMAEELRSLALEARRAFPTEIEVSLSLHQDHEEAEPELAVFVRAPAYPSAIFEVIENVRTRHRTQFTESSAWLSLTTDFKRPRSIGL